MMHFFDFYQKLQWNFMAHLCNLLLGHLGYLANKKSRKTDGPNLHNWRFCVSVRRKWCVWNNFYGTNPHSNNKWLLPIDEQCDGLSRRQNGHSENLNCLQEGRECGEKNTQKRKGSQSEPLGLCRVQFQGSTKISGAWVNSFDMVQQLKFSDT